MIRISARDDESSSDPKKQAELLIEDASETFNGLKEALDDLHGKIKSRNLNNMEIMVIDFTMQQISRLFFNHVKELDQDMSQLGITREDPLISDLRKTISTINQNIIDIAEKVIEIASIPEIEGRELGSVEVKSLDEEDVKNEILDLYAKLKDPISAKEKEVIKARIQELHRML